MYKTQLPLFNRGTILKKEMLENLRDYPRDFIDIYYKDMSDGIITGCHININDYEIIVNEGLIKHNDKIHFLNNKISIPYENSNRETILKIRFLDEETDNNFINFLSEICLDEDLNINENELELCRFKLKEGAKLRENYIDFFDLATEYNTVNILNVKHSGTCEETIRPKIIKMFSEMLLKSSSKEYEDLLFSMMSLNSKYLERNLILQYIDKKIGLEKKIYSNYDIYKALLKIFKNLKDGKKQENTNRQRPNIIIVD